MSFELRHRTRLRRDGSTLDVDRSSGYSAELVEPRRHVHGALLSGRYYVLAQIGEGGMGQVYSVRDALRPERAIALKTLGRLEHRELLKAEFRTMAALSHPNIGQVYDFETLGDGESFFTMELLDGRELERACVGQPLEQIVEWTVQACRALHYLHSRGVIHADVKPRNVLVTADGVKVLDFGLSGAARAGLRLGTPAYMAPELFTGAPPDERTDLYALGVALYELVFGRVPFSASGFTELGLLHANEPLAFPRASPLDGVIARLCHKRPEERPQSALHVIEALGEATGRRHAAGTAATRRSHASRGQLVGREREREQLLAFCLGDPEAPMAAISGPSGIGKSRLVVELKRQLQLSGAAFFDATCYEGALSDAAPLLEWAEALHVHARAHGRGALVDAHLRTLERLEAAGSGDRADEERRRFERLRALASFVLSLAESSRLVLHLGDAQWARSSTIDFLKLVYDEQSARREAGARSGLRLLVSYRDDETEGRPLAELLTVTPRRLSFLLAPLGPVETEALIVALLGAPEVPAVFSARVVRETGGNPFFIEEVLHALMERGDVYLQDGRWAAPIDAAHLEVPGSIAQVLERRVDALQPDARELLDWLAIYAQPMPLALLAACAERSPDDTRAQLARLATRHLLGEDAEHVRLVHDKLREFLAGRLPDAQRVTRHHRIARTLDAIASDGEYVLERAHHYASAGDDEHACRWAERAAEHAERTSATDAAIDNYERLRRLRPAEDGRHAATEKLLALSLVAGRYARVVELAHDESTRRTSALDRAWLLQLEGEALGCSGRLEEACERLYDAAALLGGRVPRGRRARRLFIAWHFVRQLATAGRQRPDEPEPDERRRREILGLTYFLLSVYSLLLGDDEGIAINFAAYNVIRPLRSGELLVRVTMNVALGHHILGRYAASERLFAEARQLATTDADHASVLVAELMARQATQQPISAAQRPVYAHEPELLAALGSLSIRSKALYLNVARVVATTTVWQFAPRFRDRPEVARWAEAMRGSVHYPFVQGGAALMALVAGDRARAELGFSRVAESSATPFYRAWIDGNCAWTWGLLGERNKALRCLSSLHERLPTLETRSATALPLLALIVGAVLVVEAQGTEAQATEEPWLRACLEDAVRRLERHRRLPPYLELFLAVGRVRLGRGRLAELARARQRSHERWQIEQALAGHIDGCLVAALALRRSPRADERAAAAGYASEARDAFIERYPPAFAAQVERLLHERA